MARIFLNVIAGTRVRVVVTAHVIWSVVFLAHWSWAMYGPRYMVPYWIPAAWGSAMAGAVAAGLAGTVLWLYYQRQQAIVQQAWEISQLNHNVRNAMQVISYSQAGLPKEQVERVMEALNRIGEALRTISSSTIPLPPEIYRQSSASRAAGPN